MSALFKMPGGLDDLFNFWIFWLPAEFFFGFLATGDGDGDIAGAPIGDDGGHGVTGDFSGGFDHFHDREALAIAEVIDGVLISEQLV